LNGEICGFILNSLNLAISNDRYYENHEKNVVNFLDRLTYNFPIIKEVAVGDISDYDDEEALHVFMIGFMLLKVLI
jgi:hypothetical protein